MAVRGCQAGEAVVDGARQLLQAGSLLVIERGKSLEIRCMGDEPLRTLNLYSPPAYARDAEPLASGKS